MAKQISIHAIARAIEDELFSVSETGKAPISYKTIERRFMQFVKSFGIDINRLKDKNGEIYLGETEAIFVQGILAQSIDKKGFLYKLLTEDVNELDLFEISEFMKNMYKYMTDKMSNDDRDSYIGDLDRNFYYTAQLEGLRISQLIDTLNVNLTTMPYTHHVSTLINIRKKLERESANSIVEMVIATTELAEFIKDYKEITGEDGIDYGDDDDIAEEYRQRDRDTLVFLEQNPLIKQHIENKLNKTIEDLFK